MTAVFAFSCNQCGDCCRGGGPALSIEEIFKYQNVFITGLRWTGNMQHRKHFDAWDGEIVDMQRLRDHVASLSGPVQEHKGHDLYPHIYPLVTGYSVNRPCPALASDGTCTLHDDKPARCRSVPFDPVLPEHLQAIVLRKFTHDCMTTTKEPDAHNVIFRDGCITDPSYKADYDRRLADMRKERDTLKALSYFISEKGGFCPSIEEFTRTVEKQGWIETAMTPLVFVLLKEKQINPAIAESYLRAQIVLIEPQIDAALERRNSDERPRTAMMRDYLAQYNNILKLGAAEYFLLD